VTSWDIPYDIQTKAIRENNYNLCSKFYSSPAFYYLIILSDTGPGLGELGTFVIRPIVLLKHTVQRLLGAEIK
jgi:hypothetical protein